MNKTAFSSLKLRNELLKNLSSMGFDNMTDIQAKSLPDILAGKDVIAQGKTGSGKTAAFGLGLLQKLQVKRFRIQTLVLCPTRELADQVAKEIRQLARGIHNIKVLTLCGGAPFGPQVGALEHGAHIVVGTPGRIEEHLRKGYLDDGTSTPKGYSNLAPLQTLINNGSLKVEQTAFDCELFRRNKKWFLAPGRDVGLNGTDGNFPKLCGKQSNHVAPAESRLYGRSRRIPSGMVPAAASNGSVSQ